MHPDSIGRTPPQSRALRQNENCCLKSSKFAILGLKECLSGPIFPQEPAGGLCLDGRHVGAGVARRCRREIAQARLPSLYDEPDRESRIPCPSPSFGYHGGPLSGRADSLPVLARPIHPSP